ncbi:hypothetical protein CVT26_000610 [Gymnopilus dilepis]|uniref:Uncharacterized protein n=1 Tax=Gymnopilus dilepis TaxID=231916 RepID=A0A409Y290_9AGAR|nr:hypothetical protein CVT26_000610 [Gymnopilus dilepis]
MDAEDPITDAGGEDAEEPIKAEPITEPITDGADMAYLDVTVPTDSMNADGRDRPLADREGWTDDGEPTPCNLKMISST